MDRVKTISYILGAVTLILMIGSTYALISITFLDGFFIRYDGADLALSGLPGEQFFNPAERGIAFVSRVVFIFSLYHLWRLLWAFTRKDYVSAKSIARLRAFSGFISLSLALQLSLELSSFLWHNECCEAAHAHTFNVSQLYYLIFSLTFFIIAYILGQARKNEEELEAYF